MSRKINVGGNNITFPEKYLKVLTVTKIATLPGGNNDANVDFTSEITSAGSSLSDVVDGMTYAYVPLSTWSTQLINIGMASRGVLRYHVLGDTTQAYRIQGIFFIKVKAQEYYS